jgi:succinate-semialdehyde dehydrogenase/glutarate-semialdehyde dehydrogenase
MPTILTNLKKGMPAYDEEIFGPVASIIPVANEEEAILVANDTEFGLGASIWTKDIEKAKKLAGQIEAGAVFINAQVKSDPRLPFGGVKKSGHGRELGEYGVKEFVNAKTVSVSRPK